MLERQNGDSGSKVEVGLSSPLLVYADPGKAKSFFSTSAPVNILESVLYLTNDQLVYVDENYNLVPGLLESFVYDFKTSTYTIRLKEGLKFSSGRIVDASDLEFSLLRGFYSTSKNWWLPFLGNIEGVSDIVAGTKYRPGQTAGVEVVDAQTVRIKLAKPNPSFLHSLARSYFSLVPIEELESDYLTWKKWPVGAGKYKVVSATSSEMTLENLTKSGPKAISFTRTGGASSDVVLGDGSRIRDMVQLPQERTTAIVTILFNFDHPVARHPNFRKAVEYAFNTSRAVEGIQFARATQYVIPSNIWGRVKLPDNFSAVAAKRLLTQVRADFVSDPVSMAALEGEIVVPVYKAMSPRTQSVFDQLEQSLRNIGLNVRFKPSGEKSSDVDFKNVLMRVSPIGADIVDPVVQYNMFNRPSFLGPQAVDNDTQYNHLLSNAAKAASIDTRSLAVKELTKYFHTMNMAIPLFEITGRAWAKADSFKDFGVQNGGLTVYLDRLVKNP